MKKYVMHIRKFLAVCCALCITTAVFNPYVAEAAKTLQQLKNERDALAKKTKEAKAALDNIKNQQVTVQQEIDALDKVVAAASEEYNRSKEDLEEVSARLEESQAELDEATKKREQQFNVFGKRIKFLYEKGDSGYLDVIFESKSISDMLTRMQYVEDIMEYDDKILTNLKEIEQLIKDKTDEIAKEKEEVEELVKENEAKQQELNKALDDKKVKLQAYKQDEEKYKQIIANDEKASQEVEALIRSATSSSSSSGYVYTGGKLNWPVPSKSASSSSLSSGFVGRNSPVGRGYEFHTGYDIPAAYGSNIVAAEAGKVIYSGWMSGYGNTIMIDHGGGLVTLYGHNSSLVVSKGQTVTRGQSVAKCGSTGYSTGNHCHFEVRVNGKAVSPEPYLGVRNIAR
ncbi:peptidoglycan DD-metalloendopeptidase family protein [Lachnospiraceae bacterium NSJ-143]|nr:peptidoglycan DD-metalloendopeptidase family protein [Lachnospiraceae bacterium NSJ-143]